MDPYCIRKVHRPFGRNILFTIILLLFILKFACCLPNHISDECNWTGSGSKDAQSPNTGIQPVYLRCREGSIQWEYPSGALRVILHLGHSNKNFQGCLKVSPDSSGVNLYLEEHQKLQMVWRHESSNRELCFRSKEGRVAFFVEAEVSEESSKRNTFSFVYNLQSMQQKSFSECRPCTDRELIYYFCTSDFVVRGIISSIYQDEQTQRTELTIKSREILRDSEPKVFGSHTEAFSNRTVLSGVVYRPLHCGTKAGVGEFLFLGQWWLGEPVLVCAPRWSEWKKVRRRAYDTDDIDCLLE